MSKVMQDSLNHPMVAGAIERKMPDLIAAIRHREKVGYNSFVSVIAGKNKHESRGCSSKPSRNRRSKRRETRSRRNGY